MVEQLGQYKILDRIGAGGMGEVYRARDTRLGRTVAIKVLPEDLAADPDRRERLLREARAAATLSHPNIATLFEVGEDHGHLFLAFEYVKGQTLKAALGGRPLNPRQALDYAIELADALSDAHAEGIVHRDVKPENIIITSKDKAKILDFGLASWTTSGAERERAPTTLKTGAGVVLGTVAYMSPEQALGEAIDHRTDIFSLGIVLFEMLTGRLPFSGSTPTALSLQIVQVPAQMPSMVNRNVPRELDAIVARALAKKPDDRYQSAATMAAELRSVAAILDTREGVIEPPTVGPAPIAPATRGRAGLVFALLGLAAAGAAALLVFAARGSIAHAWKRIAGKPLSPVIAVVPFETEPGQEYFADGLAEDLITRLGQTPGLRVLGRSTTRAYRGRGAADVARDLGAGAVLTGSLRRQGDAVKVSLELVDPADNTDVWTGQYNREAKDIFAVQAQVAEDVAQALRIKLQPTGATERTRSRSVDPRAYEAYLHGRQALAERRLDESIRQFDRAIQIDGTLAEAFAGRAEARHFEEVFRIAGGDDLRRNLKEDAARAYQADPDLPQANLAMGLAADTLADALTYLRRSVEIDPTFTEGYHQIGDRIVDVDPELALRFYHRSRELDPHYEPNAVDIIIALMRLGRSAEAEREADALPPSGVTPPSVIHAMIELSDGRAQRAVERMREMRGLRTVPPLWSRYIVALKTAGQDDAAVSEASQLVKRFPDSCEGRAIFAGLSHRPFDAELTKNDLRCAALMAAATRDTARLSAVLDRISGDEAFSQWTTAMMGTTGGALLTGKNWPWADIVARPALEAARGRLDAAYARERAVAQRTLAGLLDR